MHPVVLSANQPPDRFYAGGPRIAAFRDDPPARDHTPEDWVASATPLFGETDLGLTRLPDGTLLLDALRADPAAWLGPAHVAALGADPALLVKLLDAGQRLPVHAHPDVPFAGAHLGLTHGKTEAWVFLEAATVHLAFRRQVGDAELAAWVDQQDVPAMIGAMHTLSVGAGDAVLVPAGMPHAIGDGAFLVELQEPTDLSVLLEWDGFAIDGRAKGHLDLGFDVALAAVDRRAWSAADVEALRGARAADVGELLPAAAGFFRVARSRGPVRWEPGYAVVVVTGGTGTLTDAHGTEVPLRRGSTVLVPHAAGACALDGPADLEVLRCRPPAP